jgi:hypothetical protein
MGPSFAAAQTQRCALGSASFVFYCLYFVFLCTSPALAFSLLAFLIASRPAVLVSGISGTRWNACRCEYKLRYIWSTRIHQLSDEMYLNLHAYAIGWSGHALILPILMLLLSHES